METKVTIDTDYLIEIVASIHELSQSLLVGPYSWLMTAILDGSASYGKPTGRDLYHNAHDFVVDNYDLTRAILRIIYATSGILCDTFTNGELSLQKSTIAEELEAAKQKGA